MAIDLWLGNFGDAKPTKNPLERTPSSYVQEAQVHIRRNNLREAYSILQAASVMHPDNPLVLSYYGSLHAVVEKKCRAGIEHCTRAIAMITRKSSIEEYFLLSKFYSNLGRAYLAANMRKDATRAFHKALRSEKNNSAILKELQTRERRSKPPVPLLDRSNPINKYSGLILRRSVPNNE